jgi:signal transduction histidine kinase
VSSAVEQQLRERIRELETRIEASNRIQEHVRRSAKMEAIGRLAGRIAHDFNNLLTSIKGLSSLALNELEPGHPIRPDLEEIEKAAQRAAALTRQLLGVSRRQEPELVPVDLNAAVAGLAARLERDIDERIELRATCTPALPPVLADPGQLDVVITNLVVNARDAMPHGGTLEITTRLEQVTGDRSPVEPGPYALLTVRDSGTGIASEHVDRVFEPFFTTREPGERTGFGLATAFVIVQQSGGYIDVESRVGVGSTFRVYLPLADG